MKSVRIGVGAKLFKINSSLYYSSEEYSDAWLISFKEKGQLMTALIRAATQP